MCFYVSRIDFPEIIHLHGHNSLCNVTHSHPNQNNQLIGPNATVTVNDMHSGIYRTHTTINCTINQYIIPLKQDRLNVVYSTPAYTIM